MAALVIVVLLLAVVVYSCMVVASEADDQTMGDLQYVPSENLGSEDVRRLVYKRLHKSKN